MKLSQLAHRIGFLLSAPKCVACGERLSLDDRALCKVCYCELLDNMTRNCSRCSNTLSKCTCSNEYLISHKVRHVVKVYRYIRREENRASNHLVYSLKKDNRKDVLDLCADLLQGSINSTLIDGGIIKDKSAVVVTNVPRRKAAFVKFGIDHSALLAKEISNRLEFEYKSMFVSKAKKAQKKLKGTARRKNAIFKIKRRADLHGKTVLIVDDLITSGSSVAAVADLARELGAKRVIAACMGIVYRDMYTPPKFTFN